VEVDRAQAEVAAARHRDRAAAAPRDQRPEDREAGTHLLDDAVRRLERGVVLDLDPQVPAGPLHLAAELLEELDHGPDVAEVRDPLDDGLALAQQGGGEDGQGGVLGPGDGHGALEREASLDLEFVHERPSA
jgi:hypothetical protein